MTLKYESEILFDLMKRDGDDAPSDVLPYESELKEKYLEQVEGAYPKLQDYRSEWLNYNLNAHLPSDFPVETVSNVTNATFENVVPYAYGSAILKGNTWVNLQPHSTKITGNVELGIFQATERIDITRLKPNTRYFLRLFYTNPAINRVYFNGSDATNQTFVDINDKYAIYTTKSDLSTMDNINYIHFYCPTEAGVTLEDVQNTQILFVEYQDGMENWDIPYFEGMQSVKMPVLTTTGKNLYPNLHKNAKSNTYIKVEQLTNGLKTTVVDNSKTSLPLNVGTIVLKPNTYYTISSNIEVQNGVKIGQGRLRIYEFTENKSIGYLESGVTKLSFLTKNSSTYGIAFYPISNDGNNTENIGHTCTWTNIQIEEGKIATSYEPYKSNILTVNEPVELRGIGDMQDTLDLMTGEVTERIGEIVLDGSEDWEYANETFRSRIISDKVFEQLTPSDREKIYLTCDKYKSIKYSASWDSGEFIVLHISKQIVFRDERFANVNDWKQYLSQNPITVQYHLATESIKTVDLTVTDQDGNTKSIIRPIEGTMHVSTSSQTLPPLLDMSVPVEATSQNLMSFVNIVEEE